MALLALPMLMTALDTSVLYLALPHLSLALGATSVQQLWILDIYVFLVAGLLMTMGTVGERIGRRRLLLAGAAAFGAASVLAAYSTSVAMLVVARAAMGIAGAALLPTALSLISCIFVDARRRAAAIAIGSSCVMIGAAIGPVAGGLLLGRFWWGSVFLVGAVGMVVLLAAGPLILPEYRRAEVKRPDLTSVVLSLVAILSVVYGVKELARNGWHPIHIVMIVAGASVGAAFLFRQRFLADPLVNLSLFRRRRFTGAFVVMLGSQIVLGGTYVFIPLYLQLVQGFTPVHAGAWLVPQSVTAVVSTQLSLYFVRRFPLSAVLAGALIVCMTGCVLLVAGSGLWLVIAGSLVLYLGVLPVVTLASDLVVGSVDAAGAGSVSSLLQTNNHLGSAVGLAFLGSIGSAVYRGATELPLGLRADQAEQAKEGLSGALAVAARLPAGDGDRLVDSARQGFVMSMHVVGGLGALAMLALAVFAFILLRPRPGPGDGPRGGVSTTGAARRARSAPSAPRK
ncbi:MFS transporter [Amycolatopsis thermoflava]|uniref:MFS transporter n=1 Tax=Amycolatopsis thermoflava TaxID=84480 RepID=UPI00041C4AC4|nr:MFS transporter [Amycolatopsis thermoflava]